MFANKLFIALVRCMTQGSNVTELNELIGLILAIFDIFFEIFTPETKISYRLQKYIKNFIK